MINQISKQLVWEMEISASCPGRMKKVGTIQMKFSLNLVTQTLFLMDLHNRIFRKRIVEYLHLMQRAKALFYLPM